MKSLSIYIGILACTSLVVSQRVTTCTRTEVSNTPAGDKCFHKGNLPHADEIENFLVGLDLNPFDTCRDACLDHGQACKSYSLNQVNGQCRIFRKSLVDQGFKNGNPTSKTFYWDAGCWRTVCVTKNSKVITQPGNSYDDIENPIPPIDLPFSISLYGHTTKRVYMSVNGFLSLSGPPDSSYNNQPLPDNSGAGNTYLPDYSVCGYWNDLFIRAAQNREKTAFPDQRLTFTISGIAPTRSVIFNWRATYNSDVDYLNMDMTFREDQPGLVKILYNQVGSDLGADATYGAQSISGGNFIDASLGVTGKQVYRGVQLTLTTGGGSNSYNFIYPP